MHTTIHRTLYWLGAAAAALSITSCTAEVRDEVMDPDEIWDSEVTDGPDGPFVAYEDRGAGFKYNLPRPGMNSIADLIATFPQEARGVSDPDTFTAEDLFNPTAAGQCRGGAPDIIDEFPMVVEGVVTVYPRQYMKVVVCGQDERHYGTFTIEDDTGGIVVLRDSRVAPYTYGDRVRVTVYATMLTFGRDPDTRAVLAADVELAEQAIENGAVSKTIAYEQQQGPLSAADASKVKQVEGFVHVAPTSQNFGSMTITDRAVQAGLASETRLEGPTLQCARTCEVTCINSRCQNGAVCSDACVESCLEDTSGPAVEDLPQCWQVGIDAELQRRGFSPPIGSRVRVRGPVVNNFDRQIWVLGLGQVQILD